MKDIQRRHPTRTRGLPIVVILLLAACKSRAAAPDAEPLAAVDEPASPGAEWVPAMVRDTEGRRFVVSCPPGDNTFRGCLVKGASPDVVPQTELHPKFGRGAFFIDGYRVRAVCDGHAYRGGSAMYQPGACRPLACATDSECPQSTYRARAPDVCLNGICQRTDVPLMTEDVINLCEVGQGSLVAGPSIEHGKQLATSACPYHRRQDAKGGPTPNDVPCTVPTTCRQP